MMRLRGFAPASLMCLLALGTCDAAEGATILVRQDGTGDYTLIRPGISAATNGDTVLVGPGEYYEPTIEIRKPVHLISEEKPIVTTIRMYSGWVMECVTVVDILNVAEPCTVEGFTIRGARDGFAESGGGIFNANSNTTIRNNIITDNWCSGGGGMDISGSPGAVVEYNLITLNEAVTGGGIKGLLRDR
ncbi:MAG: right-handed parallel beta-helix repeat-containing protein [Candidatus Krumholzibacteriota bacterium]|nr:right-handed parallel beta-helix repeat-containing protein [Candidatus Krumholzibacteriota bacterium]